MGATARPGRDVPPRRHHAQDQPRAPRRDPPPRRGRDAIDQVWTLWVECDTPASAQRLRAFSPRPSALIRSGTGPNLHAYFALREPVDVDQLEAANRRLAAAIGGDPVCYDAARILRPPATRNFKHRPPRPVSAEWVNPAARRPLAEWLRSLPQLDPHAAARTTRDPRRNPRPRSHGRAAPAV